MRINVKYIAASILIVALCAGAAYAAFTITSAPVYVDLRYTITITQAYYIPNSGMYLQAQVLTPALGGVLGATISFWASTDGVTYNWIGYGNAITDGSGLADFTWTGAAATQYYFEATCTL